MAYEDFTTYTEVDPLSRISKTATQVVWTDMLTGDDGEYVYCDKGVDHFDRDFIHELAIALTATEQGCSTCLFWAMTNDLDDYEGIRTGGKDGLFLYYHHDNIPNRRTLYIRELDGGDAYNGPVGSAYYEMPLGSTRYLKIVRDESVGTYGRFYCYVYSDFARTILLKTLYIDLHSSKKDYRYIMPIMSADNNVSGTTKKVSGWSANLEIFPLVSAPTVTTDLASSVTAEEATLNGTLDDDGGEACDCGFEWGETVAYGNTTPTQSRTTGQTFSQAISGLTPGETYHFRAVATNAAGTSHGADRTFTTVAAPTVTTDPATGITHEAADLNGELPNDGGEACDCGFEWGETIAYGNTTPTQSRTTGQTFAQTISGLDPGKTYHFRALATNVAGTSHGADRTFTTPVVLSTVTTDPATALSAIAATLNGTLDHDGGEACDCGFEWGLDTGYGTITATESKTLGESFSQVIGGLSPATTYHFRAFAINSIGTSYGADRSFASAQVISRSYALARREL